MVQTMKLLIVEPSPLPILIPLGPKYSPQDPVFKYSYVENGAVKSYWTSIIQTLFHMIAVNVSNVPGLK